MKKFATKQQLARLAQMFASNQLPFEATQIFIETHSKKKNKASDPRLTYWEDRFADNGKLIMECLQPFYGWKPTLNPAPPDLEARAKEAVFWTEISGIRVLHRHDWIKLADALAGSLRDSLRVSVDDELEPALKDSLKTSLKDSLRLSFWVSFRELLEPWFESPLGRSFEAWLEASLEASLFYSCSYIIAGEPEEAAKFRPLHELWLAGIWPIGLDKQNNLLILVGE